MVEIRWNGPEFFPRWNRGASRSDLHAGTRFSSHSGRNGTELTTLVKKPWGFAKTQTDYTKKKISIVARGPN